MSSSRTLPQPTRIRCNCIDECLAGFSAHIPQQSLNYVIGKLHVTSAIDPNIVMQQQLQMTALHNLHDNRFGQILIAQKNHPLHHIAAVLLTAILHDVPQHTAPHLHRLLSAPVLHQVLHVTAEAKSHLHHVVPEGVGDDDAAVRHHLLDELRLVAWRRGGEEALHDAAAVSVCGDLLGNGANKDYFHRALDDLLVEGVAAGAGVALNAALDDVRAVDVRGEERHGALQRRQHDGDLRRRETQLHVKARHSQNGDQALNTACAVRVGGGGDDRVLHTQQL